MSKNYKLLFNIILIALMSALCFSLTFVSIPFGTSKVHLGNFSCILTSLLFGPIVGGISGSLGMGLNDLLLGYPPNTFIRTFIAKFIMGFICGIIFKKLKKKDNISYLYLILPLAIFFIISITTLLLIIIKQENINILIPIFSFVISIMFLISLIITKNKYKKFNAVMVSISYATILNFILEFGLKIILNTILVSNLEASIISALASLPSVILTGIITIIFTPLLYYPISKTLHIIKYEEMP